MRDFLKWSWEYSFNSSWLIVAAGFAYGIGGVVVIALSINALELPSWVSMFPGFALGYFWVDFKNVVFGE